MPRAGPRAFAGIAAKALIPGVGGALSRLGASTLADALRGRKAAQAERDAADAADEEVSNLKPLLHTNQLLSRLEEAVSTTAPDSDPGQIPVEANTAAEARLLSISAEASLNVYASVLESKGKQDREANLHAVDREWLLGLDELIR